MLHALKRDPAYRSADITVLDRNKKTSLPKGVRAVLGPGYLDKLSNFDLIFRTPGFPFTNAKLQAARRKGVGVSSVTRYFFEHAPCPVIGKEENIVLGGLMAAYLAFRLDVLLHVAMRVLMVGEYLKHCRDPGRTVEVLELETREFEDDEIIFAEPGEKRHSG